MSTIYNNGLALGTGFDIQAPTLIDKRGGVQYIVDLNTLPYQCVGLLTYVQEDGNVYKLTSSGWKLIAQDVAFDTTPTANSFNAVYSGGIYDALQLKADLVDGFVPTYQLQGYIPEILNGAYVDSTTFNDVDGNPYSPVFDALYVDVNTNVVYRWSGMLFVSISTAIVLGETSTTAYRGDRGKVAYDHSQITNANPHGATHAQILSKLGGDWHFNQTQHDYLTNVTDNDTIGLILGAITVHPTYVTPMSSITNVSNTYEVGSSQNINITQTFTQNNGGAKTSEVITKNASTVAISSTFSETLSVPLGNTVYSGKVNYSQGACINNNLGQTDCTGQITSGQTTSPARTVIGAYRRYASSVSTFPATGADLRTALIGTSVINSPNNFTFTTGTTNKRFIIAIPATKTLSTVQNTGTNEFLNFTLSTTITTVPDAAGVNVSYKVYTLENAVPFPSNYTLNVILT